MPRDEHVIEALGRSRIVVVSGIVEEVGPAMIKECPLAKRFAQPVIEMTPESVRLNIENRIRAFGMCTKERSIASNEDFVIFGASELISEALSGGMLDSAVLACDGAGTVVVTKPQTAQGIGGKMSGLMKTSPIPEVIERIESAGAKVLDPLDATINQVKGTALAYRLGFTKVAVTVAQPEPAEEIRKVYPEALIFGVHLTGISKEDAERLVAVADIVSGCASKWIREVAGKAALMQAGSAIPVFALTKRGKALLALKILATSQKLLVKTEKLPYLDGKCPQPLI